MKNKYFWSSEPLRFEPPFLRYGLFNPNQVTSKKLAISSPGAFYGTFLLNGSPGAFLALLIINYVLIHLQEISNQFTWSLFWHFLKKIKKKIFAKY